MEDKAYKLVVTAETAGKRLDLYLSFCLPNFSRSYLKNAINSEKVFVNGGVEFHPQYRMRQGDVVELALAIPSDIKRIAPAELDLNIVFENEQMLVINKPAGVVVHPGSAHYLDTLANGVKYYLAQKGEDIFGDERAGLVHRLDKPTSGLILIAKTPEALWHLSRQFAERKVHKMYIAAVKGSFPKELTISNKIGRDKYNRQKFSSRTSKGKVATTKFQRVATSTENKYALVFAFPETGRTHQIRVHLSEAGFPILGDTKYGGEKADRLCLHAFAIKLALAEGIAETSQFVAELPQDFKAVLLKRNFPPAILGENSLREAAALH